MNPRTTHPLASWRTLLGVLWLFLLPLGGAQAALIGVAPSAPDFQFLESTVVYDYDSVSGEGVLSVTLDDGAGEPTIFGVNFRDENDNLYTPANTATGSGFSPTYHFFTRLSLQATIDGATGALLSGGTVLIEGILDFAPYGIVTKTTLLMADLTEIGFADANKIDFLAGNITGHPAITSQFSELGVIVNNSGFTGSWQASFTDPGTAAGGDTGGQAKVDVTTPAVPVPGSLPLTLLGLVGVQAWRRRRAANAGGGNNRRERMKTT